MLMKDATRCFGRVGIFIPLILIFLTAADTAFACPGHTTKVAYRTRSINTRTVPTTVITYRAPASYQRCRANTYVTRDAKYVAVRRNGSSARYVAVRNEAPAVRYVAVRNYVPRTKYVAVRKMDLDDDLRYVAVRRDVHRPEAGTRHIAVRSGYRKGNGIVAYIDGEPSHVAVRRVVPQTKYVAVRHVEIEDDAPGYVAVRHVVPRTRYVAVRNIDSGCTRAAALRSCLGEVETTSVRRVVLRDDDDEVLTKHVVLRDEIDVDDVEDILERQIDDDDGYVAVSTAAPTYVNYSNAVYTNGSDRMYIAANDLADTCSQAVAVRTCRPVALNTRTIAYGVSDDDDRDDEAFLHQDATYVVADDMEDACLSRQVVYSSPQVVTTRTARYIPAEMVAADSRILDGEPIVTQDSTLVVNEMDPVLTDEDADLVVSPASFATEDASLVVAEPTLLAAERVVTTQPRWVAMDEDRVFNDLDPTWVDEVEAAAGEGTVSYVPGGDVEVNGTPIAYVPVDDAETQTTAYVPVEDVEEATEQTVSEMPVVEIEDTDMETVSYVPADDIDGADIEAVAYMPIDEVEDTSMHSVNYLPVAGQSASTVSYVALDGDDDPMYIADGSMAASPVYVADGSTVLVAEVEGDLAADFRGTQQIASRFGYRDGFEDGQEAALEGDLYHPENSGDYEKATEGYEDEFGDKDVYKDAYRKSYLAGYSAGFASGKSV